MYRIIEFKQGKGKTLARFNTEEEVAQYHSSTQDKSGPASGETTKKHCIVEFERGTDNCELLAQFDSPEEAAEYHELKERYEQGKVGDVEVKQKLIKALEDFLEPIRERRLTYARQSDLVLDILNAGSARMSEEARETLELVREAMGLQSYLRQSTRSEIEVEKALEGLAFL